MRKVHAKTFLGKSLFVLMATFSIIFVSCSSDDGSITTKEKDPQETTKPSETPDTPTTETAAVTSVTLSADTLTIGTDESSTLTATVTGIKLTAENKKVTWTTSRDDVATVSDGKITAVAAGTARITATSTLDATKSAYCDVTVESNTTKASTKNEIPVGTSSAAYNFSYSGNGATIYVYSQSSGLNFYGIKVGSNTWNPATFGAKTYSSTTELTSNNVTFTAVLSSTDTMSIDSSSAKIDGTNYTYRFKTGGGGSQTSRCLKISVDSATDFVFYAVSSNSSSTRTMIVEVVENDAETVTIVRPTGITLDKTTASLARTDDEPYPTTTLTATITNADKVTDGYDKITWTSSNESVATVSSGTVTAKGKGEATITATTVNGYSATCVVTVTSSMTTKTISLTDTPSGYASLGTSYKTSGTATTVTTRAELIAAVKNGGIIIIDGMIDMSDGMMPAVGNTMVNSTTALDTFVKNTSGLSQTYSGYADWVTKYSKACNLTTEDDQSSTPPTGASRSSLFADLWILNKAYGDLIKLTIPSNTTLIGKNEKAGIRGGSIQLNGVSNVQIRNLTLQDACDPFPHHEVNSKVETDGYNAQWDCITVQGSCTNVWIDHCTLEDTLELTSVKTAGSSSEKWQTYDGLCDMKNASTNITVSNCYFNNHDKTMLIGSSDSDGDNSKRFISLIGNYFYNCGQRLPMVRNTTLHVLNNYYDASSPHYAQSYAVGVRQAAIIYAENNYFGSGIQYSFKDSDGSLYSSGNEDKSSKGRNSTLTGTTLFKDAVGKYSYTAVSAAQAKTNAEENAGAGYTLK